MANRLFGDNLSAIVIKSGHNHPTLMQAVLEPFLEASLMYLVALKPSFAIDRFCFAFSIVSA